MSKMTGLGLTTLNVADNGGTARDIKNDVTNFTFSTPRAVQDVTGVDKFAKETLLLLADYSLNLSGVLNPAATTSSHAVLSTVPTSAATSRATSIVFGTTPAITMTATVNFTDYQITRGNGGEVTWSAPAVLANGTSPAWS
jgi:hypothetical protein